jgi:hypothetical protein
MPRVRNVTALSGLTGLEKLYLVDMEVTDLVALCGLTLGIPAGTERRRRELSHGGERVAWTIDRPAGRMAPPLHGVGPSLITATAS